MQSMFPYKWFTEVEVETSKKAAEVEKILAATTCTSCCVPADGNMHQGMTKWTQSERQKKTLLFHSKISAHDYESL